MAKENSSAPCATCELFSDPINTQFSAANEIEEVLIEALIFSSFTAANKRDLSNYVGGSLIEADRL
jgi:hypothetical protein